MIDGQTGFAYRDHSSAALMGAVIRALDIYRNDPAKLAGMQQKAVRLINRDYTWDIVVKRYLKLYDKAVKLTKDLE